MKYTGRVSPVSGGGGAELTETSLHSPVTASVDPALESLSGRRLLRAAPRCKHKCVNV